MAFEIQANENVVQCVNSVIIFKLIFDKLH